GHSQPPSSTPLAVAALRSNETLLLTAPCGVRQAVAVLAHVARPAALYLMRCSRTLSRYAYTAEICSGC
ncbi:hypothetical protein, partial [Gemmatimonas sp.]|uniref:hypothetical protein n=1 Tax=Gemmatimonas sp. TaxID=1962908 RepID=UPI00333FDA89